jgi:hypothetical protein
LCQNPSAADFHPPHYHHHHPHPILKIRQPPPSSEIGKSFIFKKTFYMINTSIESFLENDEEVINLTLQNYILNINDSFVVSVNMSYYQGSATNRKLLDTAQNLIIETEVSIITPNLTMQAQAQSSLNKSIATSTLERDLRYISRQVVNSNLNWTILCQEESLATCRAAAFGRNVVLDQCSMYYSKWDKIYSRKNPG